MRKLVIPPPDGYEVSTSSDVHNGPITPVEFDHITNGTGTSATLRFVGGYDETYDSSDSLSSDSIEITLFRFSSPTFANNFTSVALATFSAANSDQAPAQKPYAPIGGAIALDGTKLSGNEFVDHAVVAVKGSTLMVLDFTTDNTNPVPSAFGGWVQAQYSALA